MLALLLAAAALGTSNLAAAIGLGLGGIDQHDRLRVAGIFGLFEVAMPLVGLVVGRHVATALGGTAHQLGGGLLVAVGLYQTLTSQGRINNATVPASRRTGLLILSGLVLSIDNLVVGFALGSFHVSFLAAVLTIGAVSVALSLVGLELGSHLGAAIQRHSRVVGGIVLVVVGVALAAGTL